MAHCSCLNGHDMWNGDGKPTVWAFRINFLIEYARSHPTQKLGFDDENDIQIYDCADEFPAENLDCWYCDECHSLVVFIDLLHIRYDFTEMQASLTIEEKDVSDWDRYIVLCDEELEKFQDFYEKMTVIEAIEKYEFPRYCRVSPDRRYIYVFDHDGHFRVSFEKKRVLHFEQ